MYFLDRQRGGDGGRIYKVRNNFDYPLQKDRDGRYKVKSGEQLRVCMTSDFFWLKPTAGARKPGG